MTADQLADARAAILRALPEADAFDRADGGNRGGRYRDESSVYALEQRRRATEGASLPDALSEMTRLARAGVVERSGSIGRDLRRVQIASDAIAAALGVERVPPCECALCWAPLDAAHPEECD